MMINFHKLLDRLFHRATSFSIFFRLWGAMIVVIAVLGAVSFYGINKTIRPSAKRVVEDTLVDASRLVAVLVADDVSEFTKTGKLDNLAQTLDNFDKTALNGGTLNNEFAAWYDRKQGSQFHLYITDNQGIVIFDSLGQSVGKDFSKWNDIYLTLQGKYGARSSDVGGGSVMYVASPIVVDERLIGVASVGKPTHSLVPYLTASRDELVRIIISAIVVALLISALLAMWFRYSIAQVIDFTDNLGKNKKPHFYLGNELNRLTASIDGMKTTIENRAYVADYVHTLTHELKSPLSAIRASSEILADDVGDDDRVNFATLIGEQAGRMTALIDRLLTLAKLEQPTFELTLQPIDLKELCQTLINQQQANLTKKSLKIHLLGNATILGDEFWLTQAVANLLDNAINHALSSVLIILKNQEIMVVNDCEVLPSFVIERAFERYFSVGGNDKKGTGLGLPLVATVAEKHNGTASLMQMSGGELTKLLEIQGIGEILNDGENWVVGRITF